MFRFVPFLLIVLADLISLNHGVKLLRVKKNIPSCATTNFPSAVKFSSEVSEEAGGLTAAELCWFELPPFANAEKKEQANCSSGLLDLVRILIVAQVIVVS